MGTAGSGYYNDLIALLGFMKEATKNLHFSGWLIDFFKLLEKHGYISKPGV